MISYQRSAVSYQLEVGQGQASEGRALQTRFQNRKLRVERPAISEEFAAGKKLTADG